MKILWFEVTEPSAYTSNKTLIGGWQDSLERIIRNETEVELIVSFISDRYIDVKVIDGVTYVPIYVKWTFLEKKMYKYWDVYVHKMLPLAKKVVNDYKPDLIQIFGTEWPFGQIAAYTDIPVVIHIMGAIIPYNNAEFPPGYSVLTLLCHYWWNPVKILAILKRHRDNKNREFWERKTWDLVKYYMGRTQWDMSLSNIMHSGRSYYHVEEALRMNFIVDEIKWNLPPDRKLHLVSTGCSSFWKGPDMMLKVAHILATYGIDFEWLVVGHMDGFIKNIVEKQEGLHFEDCHLHILGFKQSSELMDILCSSTLYVHTAYIENSPNSICEAQCLGIPIVSTNVGGISTLVRDGVDGILVPANDPWQMADSILRLWRNTDLMYSMSNSAFNYARQRHADANVKDQLMFAYKDILK